MSLVDPDLHGFGQVFWKEKGQSLIELALPFTRWSHYSDQPCHPFCRDWTILPLINQIRWMESNFESVEWFWTPRNLNRAAHEVARIGLGPVDLQRWVDRPPPSLVCVLVLGGLPCPL
ncbi:unnamed protein product [Prunus armeniaca]